MKITGLDIHKISYPLPQPMADARLAIAQQEVHHGPTATRLIVPVVANPRPPKQATQTPDELMKKARSVLAQLEGRIEVAGLKERLRAEEG